MCTVCKGWTLDVVGWLVVLRIYVALAVFQIYRNLEAGDNKSLKFKWRGGESNPGHLASQAKSITTRPQLLPDTGCGLTLYMDTIWHNIYHDTQRQLWYNDTCFNVNISISKLIGIITWSWYYFPRITVYNIRIATLSYQVFCHEFCGIMGMPCISCQFASQTTCFTPLFVSSNYIQRAWPTLHIPLHQDVVYIPLYPCHCVIIWL